MKVNQEVDAMKTLGMDPMEVLVLPRLLAMMVALPLLAFYSNVMAIMGGGIICVTALDLSGPQFLEQLRLAVSLPAAVGRAGQGADLRLPHRHGRLL